MAYCGLLGGAIALDDIRKFEFPTAYYDGLYIPACKESEKAANINIPVALDGFEEESRGGKQ